MITSHVNAEGQLVLTQNEANLFDDAEVLVLEGEEASEELEYGVAGLKAARKKVEEDEDEDEDEIDDDDEKDEWDEDEEEDDDWDPDFDEFDLPKSSKKGKGSKEEEEDDAKFDEDLNEFDDLFGDGGDDFDEDDDF